ncbi:MAG: endonuclease III [Tenericutes bacterium]|jgi:endonuclease-3|nr:endonuclease III [Mycoplasmatota bacterium]
MIKKEESKFILKEITKMFPYATIELHFQQKHELLIAIMLSAQTTDKAVNKITKKLFSDFKNIEDYATAEFSVLESYIKTIGLYRNKAKNLKNLAIKILEKYDGEVPDTQKELEDLPGVGRKTANVFLAEYHEIPRIAVDTHVSRVSIRLGLAKIKDSPVQVEKKLMKIYDKDQWITLHHKFIHFGRYFCKARNPKCKECPLLKICKMPMI